MTITGRVLRQAGWRLGKTYVRNRVSGSARRRTSARGRWLGLAGAAAAGAAVAYVLDPVQGRRRRAMARDRAVALVRRTGTRAGRVGAATGARAYGLVQRATHRRRRDTHPNDPTLKHIVESEVLHGSRFDASRVNVNVEDGVVVLRGVLNDPDQISRLESECLRLEGVRGVESHLHLPGTPAPNTAEVRQVSPERSGTLR